MGNLGCITCSSSFKFGRVLLEGRWVRVLHFVMFQVGSDWFEKQMENLVHCRCTQLGLVYALKRSLSSHALLVQTVDLGFGLRSILPGILFPTLLVACVVLFSTAAICADHRRMNTVWIVILSFHPVPLLSNWT